jgi:hypothetical protein
VVWLVRALAGAWSGWCVVWLVRGLARAWSGSCVWLVRGMAGASSVWYVVCLVPSPFQEERPRCASRVLGSHVAETLVVATSKKKNCCVEKHKSVTKLSMFVKRSAGTVCNIPTAVISGKIDDFLLHSCKWKQGIMKYTKEICFSENYFEQEVVQYLRINANTREYGDQRILREYLQILTCEYRPRVKD